MTTTALKSIYDCYPLYECLFGRNIQWKFFDAFKLQKVIEHTRFMYPCFRTQKIKICEVGAGRREQQQAFTNIFRDRFSPYNFGWYKSLDIKKQPGVIVADAVHDLYPRGTNVVSAGFVFICALPNAETGLPDRKTLVSFFRNVREQLFANGGGVLHVHNPHQDSTLEAIFDYIEKNSQSEVIQIDADSALRRRIDPKGDVWRNLEAHVEYNFTYDRRTGIIRCHFNDIQITSDQDGWDDLYFTVKEPICWRYRTEAEVSEAMLEAGFDTTHFMRAELGNSYEEENYLLEEMVTKLKLREGHPLPSTDLIGIVFPEGYK